MFYSSRLKVSMLSAIFGSGGFLQTLIKSSLYKVTVLVYCYKTWFPSLQIIAIILVAITSPVSQALISHIGLINVQK